MADELLLPSWILKIDDKTHALYGWYECLCGFASNKKEIMSKHLNVGYETHCENGTRVKDVNGVLEYWCICGKNYDNRDSLYEHRQRTDEMCVERYEIRKAKECEVCFMTFSSPEEAKRHFKTKKHLKNLNPEEHRLICKLCNIESVTQTAFDKHLNTTKHKKKLNPELIKRYDCDLCNFKFDCQAMLDKHLNTEKHKKKLNPEENTLECTLCNIKCLHQSVLDKHLNTTKHKKKLNPDLYSKFECKCCNIKVNSQRQMDTHVQTKKHLKKLDTNI